MKTRWFWFFLLLVVLVVSTAIFWFRYQYSDVNYSRDAGTGEAWKRYENQNLGVSFEIPDNWTVTPTGEQVSGSTTETVLKLSSPDFVVNPSTNEFPPGGEVKGGYELVVWVQKPSNMKTFADLQAFYQLGSEGHIVKREEVITVYRAPALWHELGDYESGLLLDAHMLHGELWTSLALSAKAGDPEAKQMFDKILASFVAFGQ